MTLWKVLTVSVSMTADVSRAGCLSADRCIGAMLSMSLTSVLSGQGCTVR